MRWRDLTSAEIDALLAKGPIIAAVPQVSHDDPIIAPEVYPPAQSVDESRERRIVLDRDIICKILEKQKHLKGHRLSAIDKRRRRFAAYRLFRYDGLTTAQISEACSAPHSRVQSWVGDAFKELCSGDVSCVFKPYLAV